MKYQILFSGKKNIPTCRMLKILLRVLRVNKSSVQALELASSRIYTCLFQYKCLRNNTYFTMIFH